jgi:Mg2+-importing ATPase
MTSVTPARTEPTTGVPSLPAGQAAALDADDVLARLGSRTGGLAEDEAARRLSMAGPNAVRSYQVRALPALVRQLRSPLLVLLAVTAIASAFLGEATNAVILGIIRAASVWYPVTWSQCSSARSSRPACACSPRPTWSATSRC